MSNKLKLVDMHAPSNALDVMLRGATKLCNCKAMAFSRGFLIIIVDVSPGESGIVALNAEYLIKRLDKANEANADGESAARATQYFKRGEKTRSKVATLFKVKTIPTATNTPQIRSPFGLAIDEQNGIVYVSGHGLDVTFCLNGNNFEG